MGGCSFDYRIRGLIIFPGQEGPEPQVKGDSRVFRPRDYCAHANPPREYSGRFRLCFIAWYCRGDVWDNGLGDFPLYWNHDPWPPPASILDPGGIYYLCRRGYVVFRICGVYFNHDIWAGGPLVSLHTLHHVKNWWVNRRSLLRNKI